MAFILNSFEVEDAQRHACEDFGRPNLMQAVLVLATLHDWTNNNSDGWAYWRKPTAASTRLQQAVHDFYFGRYDQRRTDDLSAAELRSLLTPVKAFLTKHGIQHDNGRVLDIYQRVA